MLMPYSLHAALLFTSKIQFNMCLRDLIREVEIEDEQRGFNPSKSVLMLLMRHEYFTCAFEAIPRRLQSDRRASLRFQPRPHHHSFCPSVCLGSAIAQGKDEDVWAAIPAINLKFTFKHNFSVSVSH